MTRPAARSPTRTAPNSTWTHGEHGPTRGRRRTRALVDRFDRSTATLARSVSAMMFRSARLEREIDRAVDQWLRWMGRWDPVSGRRRTTRCETCPQWAVQLGFQNLPHSVLHSLVTPVEAIVSECFEQSVSVRFPDLGGSGVVDSMVEGGGVHSLSPVAPEARQAVEVDLAILYGRIQGEAVRSIAAHRSSIVAAVAIHVEPKVRWLAAQLLTELGA